MADVHHDVKENFILKCTGLASTCPLSSTHFAPKSFLALLNAGSFMIFMLRVEIVSIWTKFETITSQGAFGVCCTIFVTSFDVK